MSNQASLSMKGRRVDWEQTCSKCRYGLDEIQMIRGRCKHIKPEFIIFNGKYCLSFKEKE